MDIISIFTLFGGLALFLYGMNVMSQGLEKLAGGKLEAILKRMTSNPLKSLFLGIGITTLIQSSSAVTVMLVGLVNSGIMQLSNTVGVIMGSNIGTTITAWILSVVGIESDNTLVKMLKPEAFSPVLALIAVMLIMMAKSNKKKDVGTILIGFSILMYGMTFMSSAVKPLADMPEFTSILTAFTNPFVGLIVGVLLTAVIQSSSASVGILQALALTGGISYGMAIPIIMGQNIGTCVTALISSIGVNKSAKRVSVIHISFNLIGTTIFMIIYFIGKYAIDLTFIEASISPVGVAIIHSIFNIGTTIILLPFSKALVRIAEKTIKVEETAAVAFLDERLMLTPTIALSECNRLTNEMAMLSKETVLEAISSLQSFKDDSVSNVKSKEKLVDKYEDKLGTYLVKLAGVELSDADSMQISKLLHTISDLERISDYGINIVKVGEEIYNKKLTFSDSAVKELEVAKVAMDEMLSIAYEAFENDDVILAENIEPLEKVIRELVEVMRVNHIRRLKSGECTIEQGFVLTDLITAYGRIAAHCSNIGVALIELSKASFDVHKYAKRLRTQENEEFYEKVKMYQEKYAL